MEVLIRLGTGKVIVDQQRSRITGFISIILPFLFAITGFIKSLAFLNLHVISNLLDFETQINYFHRVTRVLLPPGIGLLPSRLHICSTNLAINKERWTDEYNTEGFVCWIVPTG